MKVSFVTTLIVGLFAVETTQAANIAVIATPPGLLTVGVFLFACAGAVLGFQILGSVKGGMLSRTWQVFLAGFVVLALTQVVALLGSMELYVLPEWVLPALLTLDAGVFFYAVFEAKRVLS